MQTIRKSKAQARSQGRVAPATIPAQGKGVSRSARRRRARRQRGAVKTSGPALGRLGKNVGGLRRVPASSVFGSMSRYASTNGTLPSAFVNIDSNSTFCETVGPVTHPFTGVEGVAFVGCQPLSTISMTNTASDSSVFTNGTLADAIADGAAVGTPLILLSPNSLNGRIAAIANLYTQYVIRDVVIEYISNCATSQADSMCIAYNRDPEQVLLASNTFANIRQICPSVTFPFRTDRSFLHIHYAGQEVWFQENITSDAGDRRWTYQGALVALADKAQGNVASLGYTNIWYVVEMYSPIATQGITLSKEERKLVLDYRRKEIEEKKSQATVVLPSASSLSSTSVKSADGTRDERIAVTSATDYVVVPNRDTGTDKSGPRAVEEMKELASAKASGSNFSFLRRF